MSLTIQDKQEELSCSVAEKKPYREPSVNHKQVLLRLGDSLALHVSLLLECPLFLLWLETQKPLATGNHLV